MQSTIIVPRLAAAAFALGLGAAVFSGAGSASATPSDSSPSASSSDSASPSDPASTSATDTSETSADTAGEADDDAAATDDGSDETEPETVAEDPDDSDAGDDTDAAPEDTALDDAPRDEAPRDEAPRDDAQPDDAPRDDAQPDEAPRDDPQRHDAQHDDDTSDPSRPDDRDSTEAASAEPVMSETEAADAAPTAVEPVTDASAPDVQTPTEQVAAISMTTPVAAEVPTVRKAPSQWAVAVDHFIVKAAVMFGYAPEGHGGGMPSLRTLIAEAYAGLRRMVFAGQPNAAPHVAPVQIRQLLSGEIIGDLLPYDHNGDPLTYRVELGPARGDVIVNANGTYIYTPDRAFAGVGGSDTFSVVIDDGRTAAANLKPHTITVKVAPTVGRWRGYHVDNLTTTDITMYGIRGDTGDYEGPGAGHIIHSATRMNFQVDEYTFKYRDVHLDLAGPAGNWTVSAHVPPSVHTTNPKIECVSGNATCDPGSTTVGQRVSLMSSTVSTISKDAAVEADVQSIADLLQKYCADTKVATCSFAVTRQDDKALGNRHQVGQGLENPSPEKQSTQITVSDTVSESDSVNVSAKLSGGVLTKLASLINIEITAAYGHTWTRSHTFTQSVTMNVPAYHVGYIYATQPVYRAWGDFTVKVGNTTYHLKNVYFDTPRTDGRAPQGAYRTETDPLPPLPRADTRATV